MVERLLETETDVDHVNELGWTALLEAVILGGGDARHTEIVRLLVEGGADPNIPTARASPRSGTRAPTATTRWRRSWRPPAGAEGRALQKPPGRRRGGPRNTPPVNGFICPRVPLKVDYVGSEPVLWCGLIFSSAS
ncbi:hypothetical protein [Rubrobacter marinus]|uniref:hypothetical protein n=1 Tax=Rubrobacter marinus TaxID=2653852 RepID=UPI00389A3DA9